jgi:probable rRNA maturation factor
MVRVRQALNRIFEILECTDKEISLVFVDDDDMAGINRTYLGRDYPTNVIAFPLSEGKFGEVNSHVLGDIVISVETAARDALEGDIPFEDEVDFLMIHGLLHLLGYNHEHTSSEVSEQMKHKEQDLFFQLHGYPVE